ncbi:hypothetical protein N9124_02120 [bacterium]|nr:hypothetical protein [Akkermansiaceae bacterium]MDA7514585.1 hypothetical protein [bacterium]MDA7649329.1 hypothetical protein [Akkermansiaceae bacterium]MDA7862161.1 hypothetical protein [Akkermansiaceae bacterium]MDA7863716.1 hypothetical protein [Akkermansiaceae bacterium]
MIKFLPLVALTLIGCSTPEAPFVELGQKVIIDTSPIANPATAKLQDLALSLPVFEGSYQEMRHWVVEEDDAINETGKWELRGDGAQMPVTVEELKPAKNGARKIKLIVVGELNPGEEPEWTYHLQRVSGGWKVLRRSYRE